MIGGERTNMPTFITMGNFTEKGKANIKVLEKQMGQTLKRTASLGGKVIEVYFTMGSCDFIIISEFPSEEAMMENLLSVGIGGFSDTETMVAIPSEKALEIVKRLP